MISDPEGTVLALFAAFCRIGACVMVMPGFGSMRVAVQIRLFLALALSMAILPLVWDSIYPKVATGSYTYLALVGGEVLIGGTLGMIARFYVLALQFAGTAMSMFIGFNSMSSSDIVEPMAQSELATLINFVGLLLLFVFNFHQIVIVALAHSYDFLPVGHIFEAQTALITLTDTLSKSFMVMLQLASPFVIYGVVFNVAIGMVNKLAPQIPIYFISLPFILAGGLILFYFGATDFFYIFATQFEPIFRGQ
jgi:flagellar biosynthetic protein FliR